MERQPLLTASLIVKDEEEFLPDCLHSLEPLVDEVVVCDTGSGDGSKEIARRMGAKVIDFEWIDDFAAARNAALAACQGEWILKVDADEVLTGDPELFRFRLNNVHGPQATIVVVGVDGEEDAKTRVFRPSVYRWAGAIHEHLWPRSPETFVAEGAPPALPVKSRLRRSSSSESSLARNLAIAERAAERADTDPFPGWPQLMAAVTLAGLGDLEGATLRYQDAWWRMYRYLRQAPLYTRGAMVLVDERVRRELPKATGPAPAA